MIGKSQRRTVGAVLRVPLSAQTSCFAITLPEADFAFFRPDAEADATSQRLFLHPILFRVAVHKSAWSTGRWGKLAKLEVAPELLLPEPRFIQDALNPNRFELYVGGVIRPATREECEGLERCAVWDPAHVEQRIEDQLAGVSNKWVEHLRLK